MSCMIKEFPSHETADNINGHNYFDRTIGRELEHWQKHDLQLCIWITAANIAQNAKNCPRLKRRRRLSKPIAKFMTKAIQNHQSLEILTAPNEDPPMPEYTL